MYYKSLQHITSIYIISRSSFRDTISHITHTQIKEWCSQYKLMKGGRCCSGNGKIWWCCKNGCGTIYGGKKRGRWVLGLASARWRLYFYFEILIPVLLVSSSLCNSASGFHPVLSASSILRCLALTNKENTQRVEQTGIIDQGRENGTRRVDPIGDGLLSRWVPHICASTHESGLDS